VLAHSSLTCKLRIACESQHCNPTAKEVVLESPPSRGASSLGTRTAMRQLHVRLECASTYQLRRILAPRISTTPRPGSMTTACIASMVWRLPLK